MRMMNVALAAVLGIAGSWGVSINVAAAQGAEVAALASTIANTSCGTGAGTFSPDGIIVRDLTGDGAEDVILDHRAITCSNGNFADTCGFRACNVDIYLRTAAGLEEVYSVLSIGVDVREGKLPLLDLVGHSFEESTIQWDGTGFSSPQAAAIAPTSVNSGEWQYGVHPVLGLSAHTTVGEEAMGIACAYSGTNPAIAEIVAIRLTPGLIRNGKATILFDPPGSEGNHPMPPAGNGVYGEYRDNSCGTNISNFKSAQNVLLTSAEVIGFSSDENGIYTEFRIGNSTVRNYAGSGYDYLPDLQKIGLRGSSRAINQLIAACPALRQDIEWDCGI